MRLAEIGLGIVCKSEKWKGRGGRYWAEVGVVYLSYQRSMLKVRGLQCRVMLVDYYGWVVNQDGVLYRNPLESGSV